MSAGVEALFAPGALLEGVDPEAAGRAVRNLVREAVVRESALALSAAAIPVMPLKGGLIATWVYPDPAERRVSDVDLLVAEKDFARAIEVLSAKGFAPERHLYWHERTLRSPDFPLPIDLHQAIFPPGRFRLPSADLFARGREDRALFGAPVILPDPLDACAHAIGHAAMALHLPYTPFALKDTGLLMRRFSLEPSRLASHLESVGLARAARFMLQFGAEDPLLAEVLARLRPDPVGAMLSNLTRAATSRFAPDALPTRVLRHFLNPTLAGSLGSFFQALVRRARGVDAWKLVP